MTEPGRASDGFAEILAALSDARAAEWERWGPSGAWSDVLSKWPPKDDRSPLDAVLSEGRAILGESMAEWIERSRKGLGSGADHVPMESLSIFEPSFSPTLRRVPYPPWIVHLKGSKRRLTTGVAIVGSRDADEQDLDAARMLARWAARNRIPVITGMARGVDRAAVLAAVEQGGTVIGISPGGPHEMVPKESQDAYDAVYRNGCIVTEVTRLPRKYPWTAQTAFLRRNRITSGLARIVIVCSSRIKGGSFNQVVWARRQGCPVIGYAPEPRKLRTSRAFEQTGRYQMVPRDDLDRKALEVWNERPPVQVSLG